MAQQHRDLIDRTSSDVDLNCVVSVVIPVFNDADNLRCLLAELTPNPLYEIIVVDGESRDKSRQLAREAVRVKVLITNKGRGGQIDKGIRAATKPYIWVLHADSQIPTGANEEIRTILSDVRNCLGCFPLKFDSNGIVLRIFEKLSQYDSVFTTFGDQGFFFRKDDYLRTSGIADWPILEDVTMRSLLKKSRSLNIQKSKLTLTTSARRFRRGGAIATQLKNACIMIKYLCGVQPSTLYDQYYG